MEKYLLDALEQHDIPAPTNAPASGKFTRYGKNGRYWIKDFGGGYVFGDFVGSLSLYVFPTDDSSITQGEREARQLALEKARKEAESKQRTAQKEAARRAEKILRSSKREPLAPFPYLARKKISAYGAYYTTYKGELVLAIPVKSCEEIIESLQFISKDGRKEFLPCGRLKGNLFLFRGMKRRIIVCEGYATGASIFQAFGKEVFVAVCFFASNMRSVVENLRRFYRDYELIIACDNDIRPDGKPNAGLEAGKEVSGAFGLKLAIPTLPSGEKCDFNDMYVELGPEAVRRAFDDSDVWEPPILFDEFDTPDIPAALLPSPYKDFAHELAKSTETPEAMAVMSVLAVVATATQGKVKVKVDEGYSEPVNLYVLTALPPANRKSAILKYCTAPLEEWERKQRVLRGPEIERQKSFYLSQKQIIENKRRSLGKSNLGKDFEPSAIMEEIANLEKDLIAPEKLPRLFINDATPESLIAAIADNKGRIAIISDEGGIMETMAGLYTKGHANFDVLLKGWDEGYVRLQRKSQEPIDLHPLLTINLIVQPAVIQSMTEKDSFKGKGLFERFLYCLPKSLLGYRTHDKPPMSNEVKNSYNEKILALLDISDNREFTLSPEARGLWQAFRNEIEPKLGSSGELKVCLGWGGKICGHAVRMAGLLQIMEYGVANPIITPAAMKNAIELARLLCKHAIAAYNDMEINKEVALAKELYLWIRAEKRESLTKYDITLKMKNRIKAKPLEEILRILVDRHIISEPVKSGKTLTYLVNTLITRAYDQNNKNN